jgi:RNA polymerase sigma factor (sigma-70 family)
MALIATSKASDPESAFLASLPTIDRIVGVLGRRYGLDQAEIDEFGSWAKERIIGGGYTVFRQFAGRCSLGTYLSVVLANLFRDYRNSRWGRWRPSAAAKRLGPVATRLEALLYRDGHTAREAFAVLKGSGVGDAELRGLTGRIPPRSLVREVALDAALTAAASPEASENLVQKAEHDSAAAAAEGTIAEVLSGLPAEDRVIIRMRFWDDFSVADIARSLGLDQKPLYRRLETIQAAVGEALVARGLDRERVATLLSREGQD